MKIRKGDKIFLTITLVTVGLYVFSGIINDFDPRLYGTPMDPREYFFGLIVVLGLPWVIYRGIVYYKAKKLKQEKG